MSSADDTAAYKYWAIISYSHRDKRVARWLKGALNLAFITMSDVGPMGLFRAFAKGRFIGSLLPPWSNNRDINPNSIPMRFTA